LALLVASNLKVRPGFGGPSSATGLDGIEIYLRCPDLTLARQTVALERAIFQLQLQIDSARSGAQRRPERASVRTHVADALAANLLWCKQIRTALLPLLSPGAILAAAAAGEHACSSYPVDRLFTLLRRDWGGIPECEEEVQTLLQALSTELPRDLPPNANILVLGAGLGRISDELATKYNHVVSIELSAPLLISAAHVRKTPIQAFEVSTRHTRRAEDQAKAFTAAWKLPEPLSASRLVLADATELPFHHEWADLVISVFFTDVVPPRRLLPEVRRVLRPGGRFIHLGPLGYHFDDADDHLSADELLREVDGHGFEVHEPRWITSTHECDERSIYECRFHNLLFSADALSEPKYFPYQTPRLPFL